MLISLLLALAIDRYFIRPRAGFIDFYLKLMAAGLGRVFTGPASIHWLRASMMILPVVLVSGVLFVADSAFLTWIVQTILLILALGSIRLKRNVRCFKAALERHDEEAAGRYLDGMNQDCYRVASQNDLPGALLWVNYRYYTAIILVTAILGIPGLLIYCSARWLSQHVPGDSRRSVPAEFLRIADIAGTRLVGLTYLLVGHFSRAASAWVKGLMAITQPPRLFLTGVGQQAGEFEAGAINESVKSALVLARRSSWCLVVIIAVLTLTGVLH